MELGLLNVASGIWFTCTEDAHLILLFCDGC